MNRSDMADNRYMNEQIPESGVAPIDKRRLEEHYTQSALDRAFSSPVLFEERPNINVDRKWGKYLRDYSFKTDSEINEMYANEQTGINQLSRGIGSMFTIAGTTFLDTLVGNAAQLVSYLNGTNYGPTNNVSETFRRWQNNVTEDNQIHVSKDIENASLWRQLRTPEFWAEFAQNQGFTLGMMASNAVLGLIPVVGPALTIGLSAMSEARQEAMSKNDEMFKELYSEIVAKYDNERLNAKTNEERALAEQKFNDSIRAASSDIYNATRHVNYINEALLVGTNALTWGKVLSRGLKPVKRVLDDVNDPLKRATRNKALQTLQDVATVGKGMLSEGFEEYAQSAITKSAEYIPNMNSFATAPYSDKEAQDLSEGWVSALGKAFKEVSNDKDTWKAVIMGALGSTATMTFQDPRVGKKWGRSPITIDGSIPEAIRNIRTSNDLRQKKLVVDKALSDPKLKQNIVNLARTVHFGNKKIEAAEKNDEFNYKNLEAAETLSIVMAADDLGMMDSIDALLDGAEKISDDEYYNIAKQLEETDSVSYFTKDDSTGNVEVDKEKVGAKIKENINEFKNIKNKWIHIKNTLRAADKGFSDDAIKNYAYGQIMLNNWSERERALISEINESISNTAEENNWYDLVVNTDEQTGEKTVTSSKEALLQSKEGRKILRKSLEKIIPLKQQREEIETKLDDLDKISDSSDKFIEALNNYWTNPEQASREVGYLKDEDIHKLTMSVYQKDADDTLPKAQTLSEFVKLMDDGITEGTRLTVMEGATQVIEPQKSYVEEYKKMERFRDNVIKANKKLGDEEIKSVLTDVSAYKDSSEYQTKVMETMKSKLSEEDYKSFEDSLNKQQEIDLLAEKNKNDKKQRTEAPTQEGDVSDLDELDEESITSLFETLHKENKIPEEVYAKRKDSSSFTKKQVIQKYAADTYKETLDKMKNPELEQSTSIEPAKSQLPSEGKTYQETPGWNVGRYNNPYDIKAAKEGEKKETEREWDWKDDLLDKAKAQDFIDSGKLAEWVRMKEAKKEPKTIHFVIVRNGKENPMFGAIEVEHSDTTIDAVNENGEIVHLQLLGRVTSNEFKEDVYKKFHEHAIEQTSHFRDNEGNTPNITVVNETTTITGMFSGRMFTGQKEEKTTQPYTLAQLVENEDPDSWALMLKIGDDIFVQDNGESIDSKKIVDPNAYTKSSGWTYIITKEPNGNYYPKALQLADFNLKWWKKNNESPVAEVLKSMISKLFEEWSDNPNKNKQKIETFLNGLHDIFYFGQKTDKKLAISRNVILLNNDQLGILGADNETNAETLLSALLKAGLRFNITKMTFNDFSNMDLVNSNIFTTNLKSLHNFGASFKIARMVEKNGEFKPESDSNAKVDTSTPLSSRRPSGEVVNKSRTKLNISIDGSTTTIIYDESDQKYYSEDGIEINDANTLELARTLYQARKDQLPKEYFYKDGRSPVFKVTFKDGSTRFIRRDGTVIASENQNNVKTDAEIEAARNNKGKKRKKTDTLSSDNLFEATEEQKASTEYPKPNSGYLGIKPGGATNSAVIGQLVAVLDPDFALEIQETLKTLGYGEDLFSQLFKIRNMHPEVFSDIENALKTNNIETATEIINQVLGCK